MNLVQDGKFINDERGNPFAVLYSADDAAKVVAACNAHEQLLSLLARAVRDGHTLRWQSERRKLINQLQAGAA